jgi:hypothetical protein
MDGRDLRYLPTAGYSLFCETGSFGKASFAPASTHHSSLVTLVAAIGRIGSLRGLRVPQGKLTGGNVATSLIPRSYEIVSVGSLSMAL